MPPQLETQQTASAALEGPNLSSLLRQLGFQLHAILLRHMRKYRFSAVGALRLKRDLTEYSEAVARFDHQSAALHTHFDSLCSLANLFIVVPQR